MLKICQDRKELLNIEALKEFLLDEYKEENTNVKFIEDICLS